MSANSFLERLLDGAAVEWVPIGEVSEIYGGLTGKSKADFQEGNAKYVSYKNIFNNIEVDTAILELVKVEDNERQHKVQYGDVLFTGSSEIADEAGMSSAVTCVLDEPVYLNSFSFGLRFNDGITLKPEFAKYLFRTHYLRTAIANTASGVTRFNVSKAQFKKILIPIPCPNDPARSLKIQAEIVRILDTFTELTAELTARAQQFEYYREELLSFEERDVEWKTLGDLTVINTGSKPSEILDSATSFEYINAGTTRSGYTLAANCDGDTVTTPSRGQGGIGYVGYQREPFWLGPLCYKLQSVDHNVLTNKYLFYFLQSRSKLLLGLKKEGGVPAVNKSDLVKLAMPVPGIEVQHRIVFILDKLDTLTNSISEGLPREIELRQQQYEYYRDLLLQFPRHNAQGTIGKAQGAMPNEQ
ncbi:MAG: restriction endonuclease subunit S [Bacteroidetes bacterium]|nr:restriction endonuclease subunit S [Bacteroidota bacterium]